MTAQDIEITQNYDVEGYYTIRKYKAGTDELVWESAECPNLITNAGLDNWCTYETSCDYHFVGTSSVAPAYTDTQMGTFLAYVGGTPTEGSSGASYPNTDFWNSRSWTRRFGVGVAAGNLTEVGVGWSSAGVPTSGTNRVFSRALIVDGGGSPITLTVLSDEYLDVTYTLRTKLGDTAAADSVYNVTISGTVYTFTARASRLTTLVYNSCYIRTSLNVVSGALSAIWAGGAGSTLGDSSSNPTFVNLDIKRPSVASATATRAGAVVTITQVHSAGLGDLNISGGITVLEFSTGAAPGVLLPAGVNRTVQMTVSPAIPKDATKILTLTLITTITRL